MENLTRDDTIINIQTHPDNLLKYEVEGPDARRQNDEIIRHNMSKQGTGLLSTIKKVDENVALDIVKATHGVN